MTNNDVSIKMMKKIVALSSLPPLSLSFSHSLKSANGYEEWERERLNEKGKKIAFSILTIESGAPTAQQPSYPTAIGLVGLGRPGA